MYQIRESCISCHHCELACPTQAVYYDGSKYGIAPDQCVECGLCETLCPACSIYDDAESLLPSPHERITRECDLVVCGGGSGLVAAIKAGQLGKKVILLEKAKCVGGNMNLARAFFPAYSKLHADHGLEDVREEAVAKLSALRDGAACNGLVHTAVYGCSEFTDWLLEFPGVYRQFSLDMLGEETAGEVFGHAVLRLPARVENKLSKDPFIGPGLMGSLVKKTMLEAIPSQRLDVEILLEHEAVHLITDDAGTITGVVAKDPGGETEIICKAVILATGGFSASDEKLRKFGFSNDARPPLRLTVPSNTGDAIDMLQELGVEPDIEHLLVSTSGPSHRPFSYSLCHVFDYPASLIVDCKGRCLMDESICPSNGAGKNRGSPVETAWGIYTQQNINDIMEGFINNPSASGSYDNFAYYQEDLDRESGYKKPPVFKAETIEGLAGMLGVDPAALKKAIEDYNCFCHSGHDPELNKIAEFLVPREEGPYYAIYGQLFSEFSAGGLKVDSKCRVLHNDSTHIPGLYATGDATSAMRRSSEPSAVSGLSWALASAYRSAVESAKEMEVSV